MTQYTIRHNMYGTPTEYNTATKRGELKMNRKYTYTWTPREDLNAPNNGYTAETDFIICEPPYDFMDWLNDSGAQAEQDGNTYYILDVDGDRTGESYLIISAEYTDEDLIG